MVVASPLHFERVLAPSMQTEPVAVSDPRYYVDAMCCLVKPVHVLSDLLRYACLAQVGSLLAMAHVVRSAWLWCSVLLLEKPMSNYRHLKRVKRLENGQTSEHILSLTMLSCVMPIASAVLMVCLAVEEAENWVLVALPPSEENDYGILDTALQTELEAWLMERFPMLETPLQLRSFQVPRQPASNYEDYKVMNAVWPTTFHREATAVDSTQLEWEQLEPDYKELIRAKAGELLASPTSLLNEREGKGLLIDPTSRAILTGSLAEDGESDHPLKHTVMHLLDRLGQQQKLAAETRRTATSCPCPSHETSVATLTKIPYLATGYDILLTFEPCLM